jgi:hypothetical protein
MSRSGHTLRYSWCAILLMALLASALVGCGSDEGAFTPPPPTVIRANEGDAATPALQAEQSTATPAPKATPEPAMPAQPAQDTTYPRPTFAPITPIAYPSPQS